MSTLAALAIIAATTLSQAQPPGAGYVYPPVIAPGTKTEVALGGYDFTPDIEFRVLDPRIGLEKLGPPGEFHILTPPYWFGHRGFAGALPIPREVPVRLDIPADVVPGPMAWQAGNANGGTETRYFLVSALPIVLESRRREDSQSIESLPTIIAGRLSRNAEYDRYEFTARETAPVTLRLLARRLGSNFNPTLEVKDEQGREIVDLADTAGLDNDVTFPVQAGSHYTIKISDVDFRGHRSFVYALEITSGPRVVAVLPATGRRGTSQEMTFVGYGLEGETAGPTSTTRHVDFPDDPLHRFFDYQLETPFGTTTVKLRLGNFAESVAFEPKDDESLAEHASLRLTVPGAVTARINTRNDEDRYVFEARKDEILRIAVHAQTLGSPIDSFLRVLDAEGKELGKSDDTGDTSDCRLDFSSPADGVYTVLVSDRSGTATDSVYRLVMDRPQPDFTLSVRQQTLDLASGNTAEISVSAQRSGGHDHEIDLAIAGLPRGITASNTKIPGKASEAKIKLTAAKDCTTQLAYLKIMGASQIGDHTVSRVARAPISGSLCPVDPALETTSKILLTTTLKSPVTIAVIDRDRQRAVPRGTTYPIPVTISREEGYEGEISLLMSAKQSRRRQGIHSPIMKVPANAEQVEYPCFLPEWLAVERTTRMVVFAMARVTDARGKERYLMTRAKARVTFILEGALFKVTHTSGEVEARLGNAFNLVTTVKRVPQFVEPVKVEVFFPDDVREKFKTATIDMTADREKAELRIEVPTDQSLVGEHDVIVKATAILDGNLPAVSQTTVTLVISP